jgi:hypothetical protein
VPVRDRIETARVDRAPHSAKSNSKPQTSNVRVAEIIQSRNIDCPPHA